MYNPKYAIKLLLHIIFFSLIIDLLYLTLIVPFWETSNDKVWNSISLIRTITLTLSILIILNKLCLAFFLYRDFKLYPITVNDSLLSFDYTNKTDFTKPVNPIIMLNPNSLI